MGLEAYFPWKTPEEHLEMLMKPLNVNMRSLRSRGAVTFPGRPYLDQRIPEDGPLFPTESGKIELYSSMCEEFGFDPLPRYTSNGDPPPGYFRLIYGRAGMHSFARTQSNALLNSFMPENKAWLNDAAGRALGLENDQEIVLENSDGVRSMPVRVKLTPGIRPDCLYVVHGFGHQNHAHDGIQGHGACDTELMTRVKVDPMMGGTGMRVNFVRVLSGEVS